MKHLRKFNESERESLDIEYIKHCFIELIEDSECDVDIEDHNTPMIVNRYGNDGTTYFEKYGEEYLNISFSVPKVTKDMECDSDFILDTDLFKKNIDRLSNINNKIVSSIKRLKDEYPDYEIESHYCREEGDDKDDYIQIEVKKS